MGLEERLVDSRNEENIKCFLILLLRPCDIILGALFSCFFNRRGELVGASFQQSFCLLCTKSRAFRD